MACSKRPSNVLTEKQMEDVLYDMYIAEAEIKENLSVFHQDSMLRKDLLQSVFDKHSITEDRFDLSLTWYNKNLDKYMKIHERLQDRYTLNIEDLKKQNVPQESTPLYVDTTYLYTSENFILKSTSIGNIFSFIVNDHNTLNEYKRYNVDFLPIGIQAPSYPVISFNIKSQDTVFVYKDTIKTNSWYRNSWAVGKKHKVVSVYGTIQLPVDIYQGVLINNFTITQQEAKDPSFFVRRSRK
ncbi:DUF4296 domain-containing protein [Bacteroidales bacterium OttesenSCG-928-M06]|nr:DUF4296 domain-containing protein [Bacteroidales bacterium OttesenSCG-928-M06]